MILTVKTASPESTVLVNGSIFGYSSIKINHKKSPKFYSEEI
jgi:hypothetical protein